MAHQRTHQRHIAWSIISVLVVFIILPGMVGCATPTPQGRGEISNPPAEDTTPTIDDLFVPDEEYTPATIQEYIEDARIADTNRIEYHDRELQEMVSMNDQAIIDDFIAALQVPTDAQPAESTDFHPDTPYRQLILIIPHATQDEAVSMDYYPELDAVSFSSVPSANWPASIKGLYAVAPEVEQHVDRIVNN
ncbi:MAG: hypothetical protein AAGF95_16720 [Chloroflexota bacterium]